MRCVGILALLCLWNQSAAALSSSILTCDSRSRTVSVSLSATGEGSLRVKKQKAKLFCTLPISFMQYEKQQILPEVRIEFSSKTCSHKFSQTDIGLSDPVVLVLNLTDMKHVVGNLLWTRTSQPEECLVRKLNLERVRRVAYLWGNK